MRMNPRAVVVQGTRWLLLTGGFLVLQTLLLGQEVLQSRMVPIHLALCGLLSVLLLVALAVNVSVKQVWAIIVLTCLFTIGVTRVDWLLWVGWPALIALGARKALAGSGTSSVEEGA